MATPSGVIARVPVPIHLKLFVAFMAMVLLLIVLGLTGLRTLGAANDRSVALGALENKEASYYQLQVRTNQVLAAGSSAFSIDSTNTAAFDGAERQIRLATYDFDRLRFVAQDEGAVIDEIQKDFNQFVDVMVQVVELVRSGNQADAAALQRSTALPLGTALERLTSGLVGKAQSDVISTIGANHDEYVSSRTIVIGTSGAVIALALILGYAIAFSLITPVKQMGAHLDRVASGDFSTHVAVANKDELGVLAARLNAMNDELGRLYRQLEEANRNKSTFLANMSHELRTPLNAIIGFSEVLKERMFGELNEKQDEYVEEVLASGRHLLSLINDILDLSKVEAGHMELEVVPFSLPETLANGVSMVRERASRRGVSVELEIHPGVDVVEADERKVKQVAYNLLSNAVKFTDFGGRVTVVARATPDEVEVSVRDTGVGIPAEAQERIFEEFQQVASTARDQEGTGLGLPLAKRFVELHGGRLWVTSTPGQGSTFTFTLPLRRAVEPESESMAAPATTVGVSTASAPDRTPDDDLGPVSTAKGVAPLVAPEERAHGN